MDLKGLFSKAKKEVASNIAEDKIEDLVKEVANKLNIDLSSDKIQSVIKTVKSKIKDVDLEKVKSLIEKEIKKIAKK